MSCFRYSALILNTNLIILMSRLMHSFLMKDVSALFIPYSDEVCNIYSGTQEDDPMRELIIHAGRNVGSCYLEDQYLELPKEYLRDIIQPFRMVPDAQILGYEELDSYLSRL